MAVTRIPAKISSRSLAIAFEATGNNSAEIKTIEVIILNIVHLLQWSPYTVYY